MSYKASAFMFGISWSFVTGAGGWLDGGGGMALTEKS